MKFTERQSQRVGVRQREISHILVHSPKAEAELGQTQGSRNLFSHMPGTQDPKPSPAKSPGYSSRQLN